MKFIFSTIVLFFSLSLYAQKQVSPSKAYGHFGLSVIGNEDFKTASGPSVVLGYIADKHIGIGAGADLVIFTASGSPRFVQAYGDFRFFIDAKKVSTPFVTLQPGYVLYSKETRVGSTTVKTTGEFAGNVLAGMSFRPAKGLGISFAAGYTNFGFSTKGNSTRYGGLKAVLAIGF